jgi:hypothetical protein
VTVPRYGFSISAIALALMAVTCMISINYVAAGLPASDTIKTKLTDTLKSVTANVSSSVHDSVDEMIADTMDIMIGDAMDKLQNATIYGNSDTSAIKFEPKIPSGIDLTG